MTAPDTGRRWKIEPFDNGLCFQLFVSPMKGAKNPKTGKPVKSEWAFTGKYPTDLPTGIECAVRGMLSDPNGKESIDCDPKHLTKTFKKSMDEYIQKVIDSVEIELTEKEQEAVGTLVDMLTQPEGE